MDEKLWTDGETAAWMILTLFMGFVISWLIFGLADVSEHYKQGQIDALTGNIKYELVTQADSTRTWKEMSK